MLAVQIDDLLQLAARFVGEERAAQNFIRFAYRQGKGFGTRTQFADSEWIAHTERLLAGVLGASSTRAVVKAAIEGRECNSKTSCASPTKPPRCCSSIARALLQGRSTSPGHQCGRPVAETGGLEPALPRVVQLPGSAIIGQADCRHHSLQRRARPVRPRRSRSARRPPPALDASGPRAHFERLFPNGRVIELISNRAGGGFVMSFTDITARSVKPNRR